MRPRHKMTEALPVQLDQSRLAAHRRKREALAVIGAKMAKGRLTQPDGLAEHRLKYWPEIAGRGIDDAQHLGRRRLLLQSLARLGQEPRVLHRDDRLGGEIVQECDLFVAERPRLLSEDADHAEQCGVLAQSHIEQAAVAAPVHHFAYFGDAVVSGVVQQILYVDDVLALQNRV